jgi:hypothetical protein
MGSREIPGTIERMLASKEGVNIAMSLEGEDALTLVNILDQVGKPIGTITILINALSRLLKLWARLSIFREGAFASFGEFVVHGPSSQVLAYSQTTSQQRGPPRSLLVGLRLYGKVATMEILCA